VNKGGTTVIR